MCCHICHMSHVMKIAFPLLDAAVVPPPVSTVRSDFLLNIFIQPVAAIWTRVGLVLAGQSSRMVEGNKQLELFAKTHISARPTSIQYRKTG